MQPQCDGGSASPCATLSTRDLTIRIGCVGDCDSSDGDCGYVSVSPVHTLADVRDMILDDFDDDMLPGGGGGDGGSVFFFKLDGRVRVSAKQEQTKFAWDLFDEDGAMKMELSIHAQQDRNAKRSKSDRSTREAKVAKARALPTSSSPRVVVGSRKKKKRDGTLTECTHQSKCAVCEIQTTTVCSHCTDESGYQEIYVCDPVRTKRTCWETHLSSTKHDKKPSDRKQKRSRSRSASVEATAAVAVVPVVRSSLLGSPGLVLSGRKKKKKDGTITCHTLQGRCGVCNILTTTVCSHCTKTDDKGVCREIFLCDPFRTNRACFETHIGTVHGGAVDRTDQPGGSAPFLAMTTRTKKRLDGTATNHTYQGRCFVCKKGTATVCSHCNSHEKGIHKEVFVCDPLRTKRPCWDTHLHLTKHGGEDSDE